MKANILNNEKLLSKPYLIFAPFLVMMIFIVIRFYDPALTGDEDKYLKLADNLINGFYSPPAPDIYLGAGPGYPLIILPFVALGMPLISIALLNAVFYYLSIILIYKTLNLFTSKKNAFLISLFWVFYYNLYESIPLIVPETLAPFLMVLFIYLIMKTFFFEKRNAIQLLLLAGFVLGYIALTKIIFGYVLLFMLAGTVFLWILNRTSANYKKSIKILLIALFTTSPYLIYTYHLTGKVLYWGSVGGNNMYWMSSPYEEEYGNWFPIPNQTSDTSTKSLSLSEFRRFEHEEIVRLRKDNIPGTDDYIRFNHIDDFKLINKYVGVEQDQVYKQLAIKNIKSHPLKYCINCLSNAGRMLFNYPYSYKLQKPATLLRFPLNGIILVFFIVCLIPALINWKKILFPLRFLIFMFLLYFGGSLTGSAEIRMFTVVAPILIVWISFVLMKTFRINLKWNDGFSNS